MPAFLVRFAIWLASFLAPKVLFPLLKTFFKKLAFLFTLSWREIWHLFMRFLNKWGSVRLQKIITFIWLFGGTIFRFLLKLFKPLTSWFELIIAKPLMMLFIGAILFLVKVILNYFGYSLLQIFALVFAQIILLVLPPLLDFLFGLIDFSALLQLLGGWASLPPCFTELALAVGLGGALSLLFSTALICITISLTLRFLRR